MPSSNTPQYVKFAASSWVGSTSQVTIDWVFIAPYTTNEPGHGNWTTPSTYTALPNPQPSDFTLDSDGDGLPDLAEDNGFTYNGVRHILNKSTAHTDADGLPDGDEVVYVNIDDWNSGIIKVNSYPDVFDSDDDGLNDFIENQKETNALVSDSDGDGLSDAFEVQIGTNPSDSDTDGDEVFSDYKAHADYLEYLGRPYHYDEVNLIVREWLKPRSVQFYIDFSSDPLIYEKHYTLNAAADEVTQGALWGDYPEFATRGDHDNDYYWAGNLISCLCYLGAVRNAGAGINHGDPVSFGVNSFFGGLQLGPEARLIYDGGVGIAKGIPQMLEKMSPEASGSFTGILLKSDDRGVFYLGKSEQFVKNTATQDTIAKLRNDGYSYDEMALLEGGEAQLKILSELETYSQICIDSPRFKEQMLFVYGTDAKLTASDLNALSASERETMERLYEYRSIMGEDQFSTYQNSVKKQIESYDSIEKRIENGEDPKGELSVRRTKALDAIKGSYGEYDSYVYLIEKLKGLGITSDNIEFIYPLSAYNSQGPDLLAMVKYGENDYRLILVESKNTQDLPLSELYNYFLCIPKWTSGGQKYYELQNIDPYNAEYLYKEIAKKTSNVYAADCFRKASGKIELHVVVNGANRQSIVNNLNTKVPQTITYTLNCNKYGIDEVFTGYTNVHFEPRGG